MQLIDLEKMFLVSTKNINLSDFIIEEDTVISVIFALLFDTIEIDENHYCFDVTDEYALNYSSYDNTKLEWDETLDLENITFNSSVGSSSDSIHIDLEENDGEILDLAENLSDATTLHTLRKLPIIEEVVPINDK